MGEDDKTKKILITCGGLEVDITKLVENIPTIQIVSEHTGEQHTELVRKLADKENECRRLLDKSMGYATQLDYAKAECDTVKNDIFVLLERLCYYIVRPPRWRIFAYLAWKKSSQGQVTDPYKRWGDSKHVRQCGDKKVREIFARYGYSEELFQK